MLPPFQGLCNQCTTQTTEVEAAISYETLVTIYQLTSSSTSEHLHLKFYILTFFILTLIFSM
jgi:hypothetical protein